jgi:DNA-binding NtrC family response regulator
MSTNGRKGAIKLLVIDDDPGMHALTQELFGVDQFQILSAQTLMEGIQLASQQRIDVILLDHQLPDGKGCERIVEFISQDRMRPILYITAQAGSQTAIEAMKQGAFEYLSKPIDFGLLRSKVFEAIEYRRLTRQPVLVGSPTEDGATTDLLIGRSRPMQEVYKAIGRLSSLRTPILIEGESGTGKEMIARAIHQHGPLSTGPFERVTSVDFTEKELFMELFGDGSSIVPGRLRECHGGTLVIEELNSWSMTIQSKMLKYFIDCKINGTPVDTRVIFTTSTPNRELVKTGRLRSDLYYFLSPFVISVPALRDRDGDIELLVAHFMQKLASVSATQSQLGPPRVSPSALELIRSYDWPGNVAELKSVLQSLIMESRGAVLVTDAMFRALKRNASSGSPRTQTSSVPAIEIFDSVPSAPVAPTSSTPIRNGFDLKSFANERIRNGTADLYDEVIGLIDKSLIEIVMQHTNGNRLKAAKILGITRTSLRRKMNSDALTKEDQNSDHEKSDEA